MINGVPILDYTPQTLLGIAILSLLFGWIVPYRVVKAKDEEIAFLRSTNATQAAALEEALTTSKVVRMVFEEFSRGAES